MWQVMRIPANPGGQRAVLIVLVHGRQVTPLWIAPGDLGYAGLEVNREPNPQQQKEARTRTGVAAAPTGPKSRRGKKQTDESHAQEHAVGLVGGKCLQRADEGEIGS